MSSLYQKTDKSLHDSINLDQVMLMEVETAKEHLKDSDPVAVRWLEKIEQLVMEQAQLVFQARRDLREISNAQSLLVQLLAEEAAAAKERK